MEYVWLFVRTVFFYVVIMIVYRIMGKREVGELSIIDLIVSILIAEIAAISIEKYNSSILVSLVPIAAIVIVQVLIAKISLKSSNVRNLSDGTPTVIIKQGKINFKDMVKESYNLDDLLTQLRNRGIKSIEDVDYALLETSGKLSVFPKMGTTSGDFPLPVILDGQIEKDTLKELNKDESWLMNLLKKENANLKDVFYAFYRKKSLYLIKKENIK